MRVQGHILRTYPGLVRHLTAFQNQQLQQLEVKTDLLGVAEAWLLGEDLDPMASRDPTWEDLYRRLHEHAAQTQHTVYDLSLIHI